MRISLNLLRTAIESENASAHPSDLPALEYPLFPPPRLAVLGAVMRPSPGIHCFPQWSAPQLARLRPMALAGSFEELATVARLEQEGILLLGDLRYPLVVFNSPVSAPLSDDRHEQLWRWFRLPVIEQIRTPTHQLLAWECEAREGFHLAPGLVAGDLGATALPAPCACGAREPRIHFLRAHTFAPSL
ncbi:MAG: hypothetical protein HY858_02935 [Candidatus Solibacter usitatus]|nr:hypothetical protein [Candidatus Solibacter usitatus]